MHNFSMCSIIAAALVDIRSSWIKDRVSATDTTVTVAFFFVDLVQKDVLRFEDPIYTKVLSGVIFGRPTVAAVFFFTTL